MLNTLTERTAAKAYRTQTLTSYIGAIALITDVALAGCEIADGHFAGLLARVGVGIFCAAVWWSGSFRANLMRGRLGRTSPLELLRTPSAWLPGWSFEQARIGDARVQLLPPVNR